MYEFQHGLEGCCKGHGLEGWYYDLEGRDAWSRSGGLVDVAICMSVWYSTCVSTTYSSMCVIN